ncbi:MAG: hypothetical protein ACM3O4_03955 [Ignavibacteriales bacterium]
MEFKNKNPKIYILSGKAGNGKNKIASYVNEIYEKVNKRTINLSYASYLKEYSKNILNWDGNEENKPREFLQQIGIELIKNTIDNKMLIRRIVEDIKIYSYFYDVITISDARFKEEIETIKNIFDNVVVIHVFGLEDKNNLTVNQKKHISETALDDYRDYDYELDNTGTLNELKEKVESIVKENINE